MMDRQLLEKNRIFPYRSGIRHIPARWSDLKGPEGGHITALTWCPANPSRLWAGTNAGEIYSCCTGDGKWERSFLPVHPCNSVADILITSSEDYSVTAVFSNGAVSQYTKKSASWRMVGPVVADKKVFCVKEHPGHRNLFFAGTETGIYFSPNAGKKWYRFPSSLPDDPVTAIYFDPDNPLLFYVAVTSGTAPQLYRTNDGGFTCENITPQSLAENQIHSICQDGSKNLWLGTTAPGDSAVFRYRESVWEQTGTGLPGTGITCLAVQPGTSVWAGTKNHGVHHYDADSNSWHLADTFIDNSTVTVLSLSQSNIAAGFVHHGVSLWQNDRFQEINGNLAARSVTHVQSTGAYLAAVSNMTLYLNTPQWKVVSGFNAIKDIVAVNGTLHVASSLQGIHVLESGSSAWQNRHFTIGNILKICVHPLSSRIYAVARLQGEMLQLFEDLSGTGEWQRIGDPLPSQDHILELIISSSNPPQWLIVLSKTHIHRFDVKKHQWSTTVLNTPGCCICTSTSLPQRIYNGHDNKLLSSVDGGHTWQQHPDSPAFPSDLTAIAIQNCGWDILWVGTRKGGVYVSLFPGSWSALMPVESGIPITRIALKPHVTDTAYLAFHGLSCRQVQLPSLTLRTRPANTHQNRLKLFMTLINPGPRRNTVFHLASLSGTHPPVFYAIRKGQLTAQAHAEGFPVRLLPSTTYREVFLGELEIPHSDLPAQLIAGLFDPESSDPVASPATAVIHGENL
ncbi:hypothetical protein JW979_06455 [bacterium]|nr:hypothetical protein [candidate division CSSED10-310 bacterium]